MMGRRQVDQGVLFYEFSLERHVPANHRLRTIDRFVEFGDPRIRLAPLCGSTGCPSVDLDAADWLRPRYPVGTPKEPARKFSHSSLEGARDMARHIAPRPKSPRAHAESGRKSRSWPSCFLFQWLHRGCERERRRYPSAQSPQLARIERTPHRPRWIADTGDAPNEHAVSPSALNVAPGNPGRVSGPPGRS